jgi:HlyD family secretion protein
MSATGRKIRLVALAIVLGLLLMAGLWMAGTLSRDGIYVVRRQEVNDEAYGTGEVRAGRMIDLYAEVPGILRALRVREGQTFRAGDVLAEIDDTTYRTQLAEAQAALWQAEARLQELEHGARPEEVRRRRAEMEAARAALEFAESEWRRSEDLWRQGILARQAYDEARTRWEQARRQYEAAQAAYEETVRGPRPEVLRQAQAAVAQARSRVAYLQEIWAKTRIRAPWDGQVLRVWTHEGDAVHPETPRPILRIADMERWVEVEVDYTDAFRVAPGQSVVFFPENHPERARTGRVAWLYPTLGKKQVWTENPREMTDRKVRTVRIQPDGALDWPIGMTVEARIQTFRGEALAVPWEWVRFEAGTYSVWRVGPTGTERVVIQPAYVGYRWVVVGSGLAEGDRLVRPPRE